MARKRAPGRKAAAERLSAGSVTAYKARACWFEDDLADLLYDTIARAVFRDNTISFDWMSDDEEAVENICLTSLDGFSCTGQGVRFPGTRDEMKGRIEGILYSNPKGHILIAQGTWSNGEVESYIVQFFDGKRIGR